ncbi:amidohydrolase family protein [Streptomyces sp. NPDC052020]|uniref:amidohydrolase family protein n=1 Tax=Streptomyces sp. NPDC052020 TaxID=3155677 RepID=UPI00343A3DF5
MTAPGGHCWFFGGEAEGTEAIRETVRRAIERGADVIKVTATGGGITKGGPPVWAAQFTVAELDVVVQEARRAGLPVAAHAHGTEGIAAAVAAGVDTIEHCTWVSRDARRSGRSPQEGPRGSASSGPPQPPLSSRRR